MASMNTNAELLDRRVLTAVRPCVGRCLQSVSYCCLANPDECKVEDLHDPDLYFGGELLLEFEEDRRLILTWDENAGWEHHFSVQARSRTAFKPDSLRCLNGTGVGLWEKLVGQTLQGVRVHGVDGVPHVIELQFPAASVLAGDGNQGRFGDGDDTIARSGDHLAGLEGFEVLCVVDPDSAPG